MSGIHANQKPKKRASNHVLLEDMGMKASSIEIITIEDFL
jgi:hypothetical protein